MSLWPNGHRRILASISLNSAQQLFRRTPQITVQGILQRIEEKKVNRMQNHAVVQNAIESPVVSMPNPKSCWEAEHGAARNKGNKWYKRYNRKELHGQSCEKKGVSMYKKGYIGEIWWLEVV
jgi:hypothetical protein